jgi:hypothetical protein
MMNGRQGLRSYGNELRTRAMTFPGTKKRHIWVLAAVAVVALLSGCLVHREFEKRDALAAHFRLMQLLVQGDTEKAYRLTTNDYRATHSLQEFREDFADLKGDQLYLTSAPTILSCSLGAAEIFAYPHTGGMFDFLNGPSFHYRKEAGEWKFTGETDQYLD